MYIKTPARWHLFAPAGVFFISLALLLLTNLTVVYAIWTFSGFNLFQKCVLVLVVLLLNMLIIRTTLNNKRIFCDLSLDCYRQWRLNSNLNNSYDIQILKFWRSIFWITLKFRNMQTNKTDYITVWKFSNSYDMWRYLLVNLEWEFTVGQTTNKGNSL